MGRVLIIFMWPRAHKHNAYAILLSVRQLLWFRCFDRTTFECKYGAAAIAIASRRLASALASRITDSM